MKIQFSTIALLVVFIAVAAIAHDGKQDSKSPVTKEEPVTKSKTDGMAFLAKNAKAQGVTVLPDGLQYKVIREGTGPVPTTNDLVFIKYRGTFLDGSEFDHNDHFLSWTTGGIAGWQDAMQRMKVGSKWQLFVPSDLAFGSEGDPYHHIEPDTMLVYDFELLAIAKPGDPLIGTGSLGHGLAGEATTSNEIK